MSEYDREEYIQERLQDYGYDDQYWVYDTTWDSFECYKCKKVTEPNYYDDDSISDSSAIQYENDEKTYCVNCRCSLSKE